ncbi:mandelate racemase/muconate lactonizing enzyme family protein [Pseudohalocynthiibacter aestuariivivens]|jgi:cis-L-3-hydroxyproline dehydratase|uniref:Mandelate racemase/muconate lactonizing enzyme family protein n=1 Tax=Pseudohalocynthiibacter aestuariivivens TaxID=1591409 RepID=A0ABV5JKB2_9RHOB|nr:MULTISPECIES: mandelate racemase/muconate lactonizing enzyme family protein [Pseudohalocynthiibacter]MBS9717708.1 mandelate racemase/muconate lactonizing enzyme family protein [Pseudohalocynthiibacter aestuariivivens]MCK0102908.1 mandelate racemase/muconate lactonizing enzyme family protein [Pseudohalocynthiibacter sp. F2068]
MKITRISVYKTHLPYVGGTYVWGAGNAIATAMASVVVVDTDAGISGCGEFTPCGENYMVAHSEGVEAFAKLAAKQLIGEDPRQVSRIERLMDHIVQGHGYAKAPFDAACWDILGQASGQPVWMLMGGKLTDGAPMYRVAPQKATEETIAEMEVHRASGYRQFQIKVGRDWAGDIDRIRATVPLLKPGEKAMADANQGWRIDNAIRVARATKDLDFILEQPCKTYEECQQVRRVAAQPMKLDECVTDIRMAHRIVEDRGAEMCCLKISNLGGLSKARRVRDYLVENRIPVVSEDTWGGEITTAAVAHFAASTPEEYLINSTDLHNYNSRSTGIGGPTTKGGKLYATDTPGLGVTPDFDSLGHPIAVYGE